MEPSIGDRLDCMVIDAMVRRIEQDGHGLAVHFSSNLSLDMAWFDKLTDLGLPVGVTGNVRSSFFEWVDR